MRLWYAREKGRTFLRVQENERVIASAAGRTDQEAANWLLKHLDRLKEQTEELLADDGLHPGKRDKAR